MPGLPIAVAMSAAFSFTLMYYNDTKCQIAIPFHEDLFLGKGGLLSIGMWTSDFYELLELIGDDYE